VVEDRETRVVFTGCAGPVLSTGSPLAAGDASSGAGWVSIGEAIAARLVARRGRGRRCLPTRRVGDPASVGIRAAGERPVEVRLLGGGDFPAIVASPTFGVVPPDMGGRTDVVAPDERRLSPLADLAD
jgi:hypothetical protein